MPVDQETIVVALAYFRYSSPDSQENARLTLLYIGPPALPLLFDAIDEDLMRHKNGQQHRFHKITRLVTLVAEIGQPQSLPILVRVALLGEMPYEEFREPLHFYVRNLTAVQIADQLPVLLEALQMLHGSVSSIVLGQALVAYAEQTPSPELRAALPLLKPGLGRPFQYLTLHRRLKAALAHEALPIPASAENKTDNLPVPDYRGSSPL